MANYTISRNLTLGRKVIQRNNTTKYGGLPAWGVTGIGLIVDDFIDGQVGSIDNPNFDLSDSSQVRLKGTIVDCFVLYYKNNSYPAVILRLKDISVPTYGVSLTINGQTTTLFLFWTDGNEATYIQYNATQLTDTSLAKIYSADNSGSTTIELQLSVSSDAYNYSTVKSDYLVGITTDNGTYPLSSTHGYKIDYFVYPKSKQVNSVTWLSYEPRNFSPGDSPIQGYVPLSKSTVLQMDSNNVLAIKPNAPAGSRQISALINGESTQSYGVSLDESHEFSPYTQNFTLSTADRVVPHSSPLIVKNASGDMIDISQMSKTISGNAATLDQNGTLTAVSEGTVKISLYDSTSNQTISDSLSFVKNKITVSGSTQVTTGASYKPTVTSQYPIRTQVFSSDNQDVLTVDQSGNVYGVKEGTATVTILTDNYYTNTVTYTVVDPNVTMSVSGNSTMELLTRQQLTANVNSGSLPIRSRVWSSSNDNIVKIIDQNGTVEASNPGQATVYYTINNKQQAGLAITVGGVNVTDISSTLYVPKQRQLSATSKNNSSYVFNNAVWKKDDSSSNSSTVSSNGVVTAKSEGTLGIFVYPNGNTDASPTRATLQTAMNKISISKPSSSHYSGQGGSYSLTALAPPDSVTWSSSDSNVATIDQNGNFYGVSAGTVTITAYVDGFYTVTDSLTIVDPQVAISINGNSTMQVQSSQNLTANVNSGSLPIRSRVWSSSNPSILSVDQQGVVTANDIGRATITYSVNSKYNATFDIVSNNYSVQIAGDLTAAMVGDLKSYQYKVSPDGLAISSVNWSNSNNDIASIESSDNNGCRLRALSVGTTTLTLTINNRYVSTVTLVVTQKRKTTDRTITPTITLGNSSFTAPTLHIKRNFPAQPIAVVVDGATSIIRGKGYQAAYHFNPNDNMDITDEQWWTSDNNIAEVSNSGWVQSKNSGNVTIYCKVNGNYTGSLGLTVNDPPPEVIDVQSVSLQGPSTVMANHQLSGFSYTVSPSNATIKSVAWDTSNSNVLASTGAGNFKGVAVGSADAIIRVNGKEARVTVSVTPEIIDVQSVSITGPDSILDTGNSDFSVNINPSNATSPNGQGNPNVIWSVSNTSVAGNMQSSDGNDNWRKQNYFSKQTGNTGYFDVIANVNGVTVRKTVQINLDKTLKSVKIIPPNNMTPSADTVYRGNTTGEYTYSYTPSYADIRSATWATVDSSVNSNEGLSDRFKGTGEGTADVRLIVTDMGNHTVEDRRSLRTVINRGVSSYGINPGENSPINGSQYTYTYYVKPIDPQVSNPDVNSVNWTSSNPSIFRSDGGGKFTALATGQASVQLSINGGPNATFDVTVKPLVIPVQSATITGPDSFYDTSSAQTYKITWSPSNATASDGSALMNTISWNVSDTNLLNSQGQRTVTTQGNSVQNPDGLFVWAKNKGTSGSATINATLDGKTYSKNIQVNLDKSLTGITINPPTSTDSVYGHNNIWRNFTTQKYTYSYTPSYADIGTVTWGTDNTNVIQYVAPNGNVEFDNQADDYVSVGDRFKGINQGSANVTLSVTDKNNHTFNATVPLSVSINTGISDWNIVSGEKNPVVGKQYKYEYTVTPIDPQVTNPTYDTPVWSSSNPSILRSDGGGYFTAIAPGAANVQMTIGANHVNKTYAVNVQADNSLKSVTIIPPNNMTPSADTVYKNATTDGYTYSFSPSSASISSVTWSSSDTSVITNANNGNKFTGVANKGSANVVLTAKDSAGNVVTATRQLSTRLNNAIVDYTLDSSFISANGQEDYDHGWIYTVTYTLVTADPAATDPKNGQQPTVNSVEWSTDDDTGVLVSKGNGKFWLQWAGGYYRAYVSINGGPKRSIVIHQDDSVGQ